MLVEMLNILEAKVKTVVESPEPDLKYIALFEGQFVVCRCSEIILSSGFHRRRLKCQAGLQKWRKRQMFLNREKEKQEYFNSAQVLFPFLSSSSSVVPRQKVWSVGAEVQAAQFSEWYLPDVVWAYYLFRKWCQNSPEETFMIAW